MAEYRALEKGGWGCGLYWPVCIRKVCVQEEGSSREGRAMAGAGGQAKATQA